MATIAVASAALLTPVAQAQTAAPTPTTPISSPELAKKLPAYAHRIKQRVTPPSPGQHGPAFTPQRESAQATPNIVGGTPVNSSQYPSVVVVFTEFVYDFDPTGAPEWAAALCTGTVVSANKVLTAGHCETDLYNATTYVIAGVSNFDLNNPFASGYPIGVSSTWTDPSFNLGDLNANATQIPVDDIAVLTLAGSLPFQYPPVSLAGQGEDSLYAAGTSAQIVGYGESQTDANDFGTLRTATIPIQSDSTCAAAMTGYDPTRMTCAGNPSGGTDICHGDSGGPLFVNGIQAGLIDWDSAATCGAAGTYGVSERISAYRDLINNDLDRPEITNLDFTGDGHSDILARDGGGDLVDFTGSGFANDGYGGFAGVYPIGTGWGGFSKLFRVTNWNGDGTESVLAENSAGTLYEYNTDGAGDWTSTAVQIGTGFNIFNDIMVVNNWTGDGTEDLLGRTANGDLKLYESDGAGGWINPFGTVIGSGWNIFNTIITPGSWTGDGNQTLIGRTASGDLRLYESNRAGGWVNGNGVLIGTGWNMFSTMFSVGDWSGDGLVDMLGVTPGGDMKMYTTDGLGHWIDATGKQIGSGWQQMTAIF